MLTNRTYISKSDIHGYGVFATEDIQTAEVIIEYPCVPVRARRPIPPEIATHLFVAEKDVVVVFGNAAYINSSKTPCARHEIDSHENLIRIIATQHISADSEITLNYM